jgi:hypothetical protein
LGQADIGGRGQLSELNRTIVRACTLSELDPGCVKTGLLHLIRTI